MSNLFVFGNGFDIAHGFDTSYDDFKKWFSGKYDESSFFNEFKKKLIRYGYSLDYLISMMSKNKSNKN